MDGRKRVGGRSLHILSENFLGLMTLSSKCVYSSFKISDDLFLYLSRFTPNILLFIPVNKYGLCYYMCRVNLENKSRSTGWTRPPCQKEYVDAVQLRPRPTAPL